MSKWPKEPTAAEKRWRELGQVKLRIRQEACRNHDYQGDKCPWESDEVLDDLRHINTDIDECLIQMHQEAREEAETRFKKKRRKAVRQ